MQKIARRKRVFDINELFNIIVNDLKLSAPSSINNCSILFLIIMKDEGPKIFELAKTNFALNFLKNNTFSASA